MKTVSMSGSLRENVGKKDAKKNRKEGKIPCVLYGGEEQVHFVLEESDFKQILFSPETFIIKIEINGKEHQTILQDIQYHPVSDKVLHADFLEVITSKPLTVALPVKIEGNSPGVMKGGKLIKKLRKLKVKGLRENLPEFINVNISKLDIGQSVRIKNLTLSDVEFLDSPNSVVVSVKVTRAMDTSQEEEEQEEAETTGEESAE